MDKSKIPHGPYCYSGSRNPKYNNYVPCPYWERDLDKPEMESGYCKYLDRGDWEKEKGFSILWDQVKSCGINREY